MPPRKRKAETTVTTHHADPDRDVTAVAAVVDTDAQEKVAGPIPAEIVGDRRDTVVKRLIVASTVIIGVVLLAFLVRGLWEQQQRLKNAERERTDLIRSIQSLVTDVDHDAADLRALRQAFDQQNAILKAYGITPAGVSPNSGGGGAPTTGGQSSTPRSQPSSSGGAPPSSSHPQPSSRPSSHPSSPPPSQPPVVQVCVRGLPCINPLRSVATRASEALPWPHMLLPWRAYL